MKIKKIKGHEDYTTQWEREGRTKDRKRPPCTYPLKDCCCIDISGKCTALSSTKFKRPCPFYRSWLEVEPANAGFFPENEVLRNHWSLQKDLLDFVPDYWLKVMPMIVERKARGFTQREMAERLHMDYETYRRKERDPRLFTIAEAGKVAKILGVTMTEILKMAQMTNEEGEA